MQIASLIIPSPYDIERSFGSLSSLNNEADETVSVGLRAAENSRISHKEKSIGTLLTLSISLSVPFIIVELTSIVVLVAIVLLVKEVK